MQRKGSGGPWEEAVGYSRVVRVGSNAWVAGTTAIVDDELVSPGDAYGQTVAAFGIAVKALEAVDLSISDIVRTRMYIVDEATVDEVGRAHSELFAQIKPVATLVVVKALIDPRMLVEVEVDACSETAP